MNGAVKHNNKKTYIIAAHHYQTPDIVAQADLIGDSYRLAVDAAKTGAPYTIMCGVRFMAESVAILANKGQKVLMPENSARCPMADMITREQAEKALAAAEKACGRKTVPVAYMNSWADIKSFTGEHDGSICTSGNAEKIMRHYLDAGCSIFFLPDYNLGMNTALKLGLKPHEIAVVGSDGVVPGKTAVTADGVVPGKTAVTADGVVPGKTAVTADGVVPGKTAVTADDGNVSDDLNSEITGILPSVVPAGVVRVFLWKGFCPIHMKFAPADIDRLRAQYPSVTVIVHPECTPDTVAKADKAGSTEMIYNALKKAPDGSVWAVGTEECFVDRMISEFPKLTIIHLAVSRCSDMSMTTAENLGRSIQTLTAWLDGKGSEPRWIDVPSEYIGPAKKALETMVNITEKYI